MIYIYDVLVNLQKEELFDYYEWQKGDNILHVKKVPIFRVFDYTFDDLVNNNIKLDNEFLKTLRHNDNKNSNIMLIFSNLKSVIAILFNPIGESIKRSKLLLHDEEVVINICQKLEETYLNYNIINEIKYDNEYLLRKEKEIRYELLKEFTESYKIKNEEKLDYYFSEYFEEDKKTLEEEYHLLINSLKDMNNKHKNLYDIINTIKNKPI